jgi:hypothetical protein
MKAAWNCAATCGYCSAPAAGGGGCSDVAPGGGFSCAQQKAWGKCSEAWLVQGGYCARTCGLCFGASEGGAAADASDDGGVFGAAEFDGGVSVGGNATALTAASPGNVTLTGAGAGQAGGNATASVALPCVDVAPPGTITCAQRLAAGSCNEAWLLLPGYCAATCRRCWPAAAAAAVVLKLL